MKGTDESTQGKDHGVSDLGFQLNAHLVVIFSYDINDCFCNLQTYLWVLNDDHEFDLAFNKLKVAGVMTDYPSRLKYYLANNGTASQHAPNIVNNKDEHSELIKKQ